MKRWIIRAATFIAGLYFFLEFILPEEIILSDGGVFKFSIYNDQVMLGLITMASMALGLGIINLVLGHGSRIIFVRAGWFSSMALLLGLALMMIFAALDWRDASRASAEAQKLYLLRDFALRIVSDHEKTTQVDANAPDLKKRNQILVENLQKELQVDLQRPVASEDLEPLQQKISQLALQSQQTLNNLLTDNNTQFQTHRDLRNPLTELGALRQEYFTLLAAKSWHKGFNDFLFQGIFVSLGSAMFSLLGFYIASAAYRAFRIRSTESGLMMLAALLVILGQVPFMLYGQSEFGMWIFVSIQRIRLWLLSVPSAAAFRAIELGSAVAALVMSFRMWLSIESKSVSER